MANDMVIILDEEEEEEEEVQFLGTVLPSTPEAKKQTTSQRQSGYHSSPLKRKLDVDDIPFAGRGSPCSRQVHSPQALSNSQWTFQQCRSTIMTMDSVEEVFSPCSTPLRVRKSNTLSMVDTETVTRSPLHLERLSIASDTEGFLTTKPMSAVASKVIDCDEWEFVRPVPATSKLSRITSKTPSTLRPQSFIDLADEDPPFPWSINLDDYDEVEPLPQVVIDSDEEPELQIIGGTPRPNRGATQSISRRPSSIIPQRNPPIVSPLESIHEIVVNRVKLKKGITVELKDNDDFVLITNIVRNTENGSVTIRGHRFLRARDLNGLLPKTKNELCWIVDIDLDDPRDAMEQSLSESPADRVLRLREMKVTNMSFPACTYRGTQHPEDIENECSVAARWMYTTIWPSAKARLKNENACCQRMLRRLNGNDALIGPSFLARDVDIRREYRGYTRLGGSYDPTNPLPRRGIVRNASSEVSDAVPILNRVSFKSHRSSRGIFGRQSFSTASQARYRPEDNGKPLTSLVDLTDGLSRSEKDSSQKNWTPQASNFGLIDLTTVELCLSSPSGTMRTSSSSSSRIKKRQSGQKYTYGDAFCGAGGATRGAQMAGLKVIWGFDFNPHACQTWHQNFPDATLYEMSAYDVCLRSQEGDCLRCDILHMSPPCQYFSPAHTIAAKDDDMNSASLFACGQLLQEIKPRIVTLEQTFGINHLEFIRWFNALINMFTTNGYSLRWKICHLQEWGLPQRRQRLIIIASCPGEVLPEIPAYTHSSCPTDGLKPYTSVRSAIGSIRRGVPDHDLASMLAKPLNNPPWDDGSIARRAITTHGGQNYHPSGKRGLTNREFAALQGFPIEHTFSEKNVKKQIGNAVPPSIAKILFEAVRKALEEADGVEKEVLVID